MGSPNETLVEESDVGRMILHKLVADASLSLKGSMVGYDSVKCFNVMFNL